MKEEKSEMWQPPPMGSLKFNVDGAARTKLGLWWSPMQF